MIKKLIIIFLIMTLCSGCFNYIEINNMVIISGIGIDYKNDMYKITFESLYQDKSSSDSNFEKGIIKNGIGKTIPEAFDNLTLSLEKEPYFAHLKVVVISENVANEHLNELFDFFLRNNDIRNIFLLVISKEAAPEDILLSSNEYFPVSSEKIKNILENNIYSNYISKNKYFKNIASNYLSGKKNIIIPTVKLKSNDLVLDNLIIFNSKKPIAELDSKKILILSVIDNKNPRSIFTVNCGDNKNVSIRIYKSKTNIKIEKSKYTLKNKLSAEVIENSCGIDLDKEENQKKITNKFNELLTKEEKELINYLKINNSDILGINNKYYIKFRNKNNDYFKDSNYEVENELNINKKGLIFEVKNDN